MGLHWGLNPLRYLVPEDILSHIESTQVDPHVPTSDNDRLPMINGQTGDMIIEIKSSKFYRLRRDKFRRMLMGGIDIRWGKKITNVSYSDDKLTVTAKFEDGTSDTGSILVATDGPHSKVRTLLVGEEAAKVTPIDFASTMCFTQHTREHALYLRAKPHNPLYQVAPHPEGCCAWLSLHDGDDKEHPENWTFFHYISFPEPREEINTRSNREHIAHQKAMARKFVDPWRSVFEWMPDDMDVWYSKLRNWDPSLPEHAWDNRAGRVTLAGDAAHPMTFQRGQGLNHALQDSFTVCKAIEEFWGSRDEGEAALIQKRTDALASYEAEMKARAGEEVRLSGENSLAMHDWSLLSKSPSLTKGMILSRTCIRCAALSFRAKKAVAY
ncbi:FAD/NAD(P)-binding domain-containing protein [Lophiostoma macrostomum CBS 122681]|uniref:FAD/NAD(P)-binding domain-containing protein n=1 Tax=Lophiostoma macrostomum CBS 122681 TaxID=1314788 RepID=A0A6A6SWN1_9PLEO|nr:FAD/NAD(P)-binding domain-containing protein [Lophiostoma macrostomum CBS 122681]